MNAEALAARLTGTAEKLTSAATTYTSQDEQSAGQIASVVRLI